MVWMEQMGWMGWIEGVGNEWKEDGDGRGMGMEWDRMGMKGGMEGRCIREGGMD